MTVSTPTPAGHPLGLRDCDTRGCGLAWPCAFGTSRTVPGGTQVRGPESEGRDPRRGVFPQGVGGACVGALCAGDPVAQLPAEWAACAFLCCPTPWRTASAGRPVVSWMAN